MRALGNDARGNGRGYEKIGIELAKAFITVRADSSRLASDLGGVKKRATAAISGIGSQISGTLGAIGVASAGALFVGVIRSGEEFNQKMNQSLAIMGEVSNAMRTDMKDAAFEVAKATRFAASEAAESFFFLASAGLDAAQSIAALPQVAQFAQAGNFDLARATDLATDAQSALGLTVKDAEQNLTNLTRVTDVLIKANTLANASAEQFATALTNKAAAAARIVGKDIEEVTAVLAAFADQGLKGAEAGTAINIVFRDLQTRALQNKEALDELGVSVFDTQGNMRNMADIIGELEKALAPMTAEQKKAALAQAGFSDKSVIFIQTLIGTSEKIRSYEADLRKAGGITKEVADKQLTAFQKGMAKITAATTELGIVLASVVGPVIEGFGDLLSGNANVAGILVAAILGAIAVLVVYKAVVIAASVAQAILQALQGPKGWIILAGAVVAATAATVAITQATKASSDELKKTQKELGGTAENIDELKAAAEGVADTPIVPKESKQGAEQIAALKEEIFRVTNSLTDAQIAMREFSQQEGVSPTQIGQFNTLAKQLERTRKLQEWGAKAAEDAKRKIEGIKSEGESLTESLRLPAEVFKDEVNKIKELLQLGAITRETAQRGFERALKEDTNVKIERVGFAGLGKKIQDDLFKRDKKDKQEAMLSQLVIGNKRRDVLIKAVKEINPSGVLT